MLSGNKVGSFYKAGDFEGSYICPQSYSICEGMSELFPTDIDYSLFNPPGSEWLEDPARGKQCGLLNQKLSELSSAGLKHLCDFFRKHQLGSIEIQSDIKYLDGGKTFVDLFNNCRDMIQREIFKESIGVPRSISLDHKEEERLKASRGEVNATLNFELSLIMDSIVSQLKEWCSEFFSCEIKTSQVITQASNSIRDDYFYQFFVWCQTIEQDVSYAKDNIDSTIDKPQIDISLGAKNKIFNSFSSSFYSQVATSRDSCVREFNSFLADEDKKLNKFLRDKKEANLSSVPEISALMDHEYDARESFFDFNKSRLISFLNNALSLLDPLLDKHLIDHYCTNIFTKAKESYLGVRPPSPINAPALVSSSGVANRSDIEAAADGLLYAGACVMGLASLAALCIGANLLPSDFDAAQQLPKEEVSSGLSEKAVSPKPVQQTPSLWGNSPIANNIGKVRTKNNGMALMQDSELSGEELRARLRRQQTTHSKGDITTKKNSPLMR